MFYSFKNLTLNALKSISETAKLIWGCVNKKDI